MFENKTQSFLIKISMVMLAVVLVFSGATVAFADEETGVTLEQSGNENSNIGEGFSSNVDFTDIQQQLRIAMELNGNEHEYTNESWDIFEKALTTAIKIIGDKENASQKEVNEATAALKSAIASLEKVDYSKLEKMIGEVNSKIYENEGFHEIWGRINSAVEKAKPLLLSGDQAAVDTAAAEIEALLAELSELGDFGGEPEIIVQEVEVVVPPSEDFCNIAGHKVWPILFAFSAAINIALGAMIYYFVSRMKNTADDIPLVRYDIDDDIEDYSDDEFEDGFAEEPEEAEDISEENED